MSVVTLSSVLRFSGPSSLNQSVQIAARQVFHHQEQRFALFAQGVNMNDVGMVQAGGQTRFADEPFARAFFDESVGQQLFDGDQTAQGRVFGLVDDAKTAVTDDAEDFDIRQ